MTLSDLQSKKLLHLFRAFFDTDRNRTIEKADFDQVAEKVGKMRKWSNSDPQFKSAQQRLLTVWDGIKMADSDGDGHVSEEEWLKLWSEVIAKNQNAPWISQYQDFMFDAQDISGDGQIDEDEFTTLYSALGIPEGKCREAFKKVTQGGPEVLTRDVFGKRFQEFVNSSDPASPGNYLFGCGDF